MSLKSIEREQMRNASELMDSLRGPAKVQCEASWPRDSSFWKFDRCLELATRICLENDRRVLLCENHGKHKKLVAMIEK